LTSHKHSHGALISSNFNSHPWLSYRTWTSHVSAPSPFQMHANEMSAYAYAMLAFEWRVECEALRKLHQVVNSNPTASFSLNIAMVLTLSQYGGLCTTFASSSHFAVRVNLLALGQKSRSAHAGLDD
jgi:hypothetical protein